LAEQYLSKESLADSGLLSVTGVDEIFRVHDAAETSTATQNKLDAIINHMIGVQVLHEQFVKTNVPELAKARARELGWAA